MWRHETFRRLYLIRAVSSADTRDGRESVIFRSFYSRVSVSELQSISRRQFVSTSTMSVAALTARLRYFGLAGEPPVTKFEEIRRVSAITGSGARSALRQRQRRYRHHSRIRRQESALPTEEIAQGC